MNERLNASRVPLFSGEHSPPVQRLCDSHPDIPGSIPLPSGQHAANASCLAEGLKLQHSFAHSPPCPACEFERDRLMLDVEQFAGKSFRDASEQWLALRKHGLKKRTHYENTQAVKRLNVYFGALKLRDIYVGQLHGYQEARRLNDGGTWMVGLGHKNGGKPWPKRAGPSLINHEVSCVQLMLKAAGLWEKIKPWYRALPIAESEDPKVLTDEEEMMVYAIASQDPDTELLYHVAQVAVNTGCRGGELRNLSFEDVRLTERVPGFMIRRETAKNRSSARFIALNDSALEHLEWCMNRAREKGAFDPKHKVFPWRKGKSKTWDVTRPASSSWLRRPMATLQKRTGLHWLTLHVFRHQHITLRLEAGEPIPNVSKDVGHTNTTTTMRFYHHPRRDMQHRSVQMIDSRARMERAKKAS